MINEEERLRKLSPNNTGRARDSSLPSLVAGKDPALPSDHDQPLQKKHRGTSVEDQSDAAVAPSHEHYDAVTGEPKTKPRASFKAIGHLVLAMKRFQASLNPTYTYGRTASPTPGMSYTSSQGGDSAGTPQQFSYPDRGHKADLLWQRLPDPVETSSSSGIVHKRTTSSATSKHGADDEVKSHLKK